MSTHLLKQSREPLVAELRAIAAAAGDTLTPEQSTRVDELRGKLADIEKRIGLAELIDGHERRAAGTLLTGSGDASFDALSASVSALDAIRAQVPEYRDAASSGRARELSAELALRSGRQPAGLLWNAASRPVERRTITSSSPLIQTTVSPTMIDILRAKSVVRKMGATVIGGLTSNLALPRLTGSATPYWVAENGPITQSTPTFDNVTFTPKNAGGIVGMSRTVLQNASPDVEAVVENDLARLLATALDQVGLVGGGANQPSGLLAAGSGITVVPGGANGLGPTWDNVLALIEAVDVANALDGSLGFVTNGRVVKTNRTTLKTDTDTASNFIQSDPNALAGYPLASTQNVPSNLAKGTSSALSALIFGDWSSLYIGFWSELDLLVNPFDSTAYAAGSVLVRCMMTCDTELRHAAAFSALTDIITD